MPKTEKNDSVLAICIQETTEDGSELNLGDSFSPEELNFLHHAFIADTIVNIFSAPFLDYHLFYADLPGTRKLVDTIFNYLKRKLKGKMSRQLIYDLRVTPLPPERWGVKMDMAFKNCFEDGYEHVLFIGSRTPTLRANMLKVATKLLKKSDAVFGPTVQGRYYLLGMTDGYHVDLSTFDWRSPNIYSEVAGCFQQKDLTWSELEVWYAVEHNEDLEFLIRDINQFRLEGDEMAARETEKVLERILNR
jgi:hypothetical protein